MYLVRFHASCDVRVEFLLKTRNNLFRVLVIPLCIDIRFVLGEALPVVEIRLQPRGW